MKEWKVADAKARFSTVLQKAEEEPQLICRREVPVAVVVSISNYEKKAGRKRLSVPHMLRKLRKIQEEEQVELDVPLRADRPAAVLED